jgi:hypothetical protein
VVAGPSVQHAQSMPSPQRLADTNLPGLGYQHKPSTQDWFSAGADKTREYEAILANHATSKSHRRDLSSQSSASVQSPSDRRVSSFGPIERPMGPVQAKQPAAPFAKPEALNPQADMSLLLYQVTQNIMQYGIERNEIGRQSLLLPEGKRAEFFRNSMPYFNRYAAPGLDDSPPTTITNLQGGEATRVTPWGSTQASSSASNTTTQPIGTASISQLQRSARDSVLPAAATLPGPVQPPAVRPPPPQQPQQQRPTTWAAMIAASQGSTGPSTPAAASRPPQGVVKLSPMNPLTIEANRRRRLAEACTEDEEGDPFKSTSLR